MYSINIQDSTGLWIVIDDTTGKTISRGADPLIAINLAIEKGMPSTFKEPLLSQAGIIEKKKKEELDARLAADEAERNAREASPNKPKPLTGSADSDSGSESKKTEAKNNPPSASGVYNENSNEMETQNLSFAGSTTAGTANTAKKRPGYTTGELPGLRLDNPLSSLSSYTYQTTLYMITPDAYTAFVESDRTDIDAIKKAANPTAANAVKDSQSGAYIIAQSGGVGPTQQRIPGAEFDFYMDDLKIINYLQGGATSTASNDYKVTFNIYEPHGFSLITKLTKAAEQLQSVSKVENFNKMNNPTRQFFMLGLRFQGYDENGQVLSNKTFPKDNFNSDSGGVFERFFDISINSFKFKIDGKVTVYNIEGIVIGPGTGMGVKRGRIDSGMKVQGETVDQALQGPNGLVTILNQQQQKRAQTNPKSIPTEYKIAYRGDAATLIGDAPIVNNISNLVKSLWPMGEGVQTTRDVVESVVISTLPNSTQRSISFSTSKSIVQAVQEIITQSEFMENALNTIIRNDEEPNPKPNSDYIQKNKKPGIFRWYNLSAEVKVKGFDDSIKDFSYIITYVIQPYDTPYVKSQNLSATKEYYGAHKRYEYWYTGQNSEILSYEQTMNNAYFNATINPNATAASSGGGYDVPTSTGKLPNESKEGKLNVSKSTQNSVITSLFSPADYAQTRITILGDPDFLMTEVAGSVNTAYRQFYGKGFTINPNGGQVFIEIDFKEGEDYGNNGLLSINKSILFWNYPKQVKDLVKGVSYLVTQVQHNFSKGKFTQELLCNINTFNNLSKDEPDLYRSIASDPNTNIGAEGQTSVRTATSQAGNPDGTQHASNTGFVQDAPVESNNPESGNQGGSNTQPPATDRYADGDRAPGASVVVASKDGRETAVTDLASRNRLNSSGLSGA
jgi:hypothetical protein